MANDSLEVLREKATAVLEKLQRGKECEAAAQELVDLGIQVPDALVVACVGRRGPGAAEVPPCPKTLRVLLRGRANPNAVDDAVRAPAIHTACWSGSVDVVRALLEFRCDTEARDPRMNTPPLNTALAAGNAPVALELLNSNCDVAWTHEDGATPLHVAMAWIASAHNAHLRLPPTGEEPRAVLAMMLHNGVDPTATEGMTKSATRSKGMTPLETFRREIQSSPWRSDPQIGPRFDKTAKVVHTILEQGEEAIGLKNQGNKAFGESRYPDALEAYARARKVWETADIRGHHVAVLWSNEATCHKKVSEWDSCIRACEEGATHYCTPKIRAKLESTLKEAHEAKAAAEAAAAAAAADPEAAQAAALAAEEARKAALEKALAERKPPSKLKGGFLDGEEQDPLYPAGSAQGKVENPGPFICHFEDAKEAGFVDGVDGWKDRKVKEEQELDQQLVQEGWMSPDLLDDPKSLDLINNRPSGC